METKPHTTTAFDRFNAAIQAGIEPDEADRKKLEACAKQMHNFYPEKIELLTRQFQAAKSELASTKDSLEALKANHTQSVLMAKNEAGKPLYSNETTRSLEIDNRVREDVTCQGLAKKVEAIQKTVDETMLALERARNDYRAWRDMFTFEMNSKV